MMALQTLKQAFTCDVSPVLAMARLRAGGAIDPVATYRASRYRESKRRERPLAASAQAGVSVSRISKRVLFSRRQPPWQLRFPAFPSSRPATAIQH